MRLATLIVGSDEDGNDPFAYRLFVVNDKNALCPSTFLGAVGHGLLRIVGFELMFASRSPGRLAVLGEVRVAGEKMRP